MWLALVSLVALTACGDSHAATPVALNATIERIETSDGIRLDARLFAARGSRLAIFLHGYGGDQSEWFPFARDLAASNRAAALTVDFRGYGVSEGKQTTESDLVTDVIAAIDFAHQHGFRSIVLVGASMGGTAALIAASQSPGIDGVIALSAPAEFGGMDAAEAINQHKPPMGLIAARDDVSAVDAMDVLRERSQLPPRYTTTVEGEAHGAAMLTSTAGASVRRTIDSLLSEFWKSP